MVRKKLCKKRHPQCFKMEVYVNDTKKHKKSGKRTKKNCLRKILIFSDLKNNKNNTFV